MYTNTKYPQALIFSSFVKWEIHAQEEKGIQGKMSWKYCFEGELWREWGNA